MINKYYIANNKFTVSIVPKFILKMCTPKKDLGNFYRFGLVSYDRNILRYIYQLRWDF